MLIKPLHPQHPKRASLHPHNPHSFQGSCERRRELQSGKKSIELARVHSEPNAATVFGPRHSLPACFDKSQKACSRAKGGRLAKLSQSVRKEEDRRTKSPFRRFWLEDVEGLARQVGERVGLTKRGEKNLESGR